MWSPTAFSSLGLCWGGSFSFLLLPSLVRVISTFHCHPNSHESRIAPAPTSASNSGSTSQLDVSGVLLFRAANFASPKVTPLCPGTSCPGGVSFPGDAHGLPLAALRPPQPRSGAEGAASPSSPLLPEDRESLLRGAPVPPPVCTPPYLAACSSLPRSEPSPAPSSHAEALTPISQGVTYWGVGS